MNLTLFRKMSEDSTPAPDYWTKSEERNIIN